jgi:hypothetical protein
VDADAAGTRGHLAALDLLPGPLAEALRARGATVWVGDRTVPELDDLGWLAGDHPRGWPRGRQWGDPDGPGGAYFPVQRYITAGRGSSGSRATALHEAGHAIGHVLGWDHAPELRAHQARLYPGLRAYFRQGGRGGAVGAQELLAEATAEIVTDEERARLVYDDAFVDWMLAGPLSGRAYVA